MQLTAEQLEAFRTVGLRLDRAGVFWHGGAEVTHQRLRLALLSWLDVREDGRDIIRLDDKRYAYVDVEDAHLRARSVRWDGDRAIVLWDDDRELELAYASLRQAEDHALYAEVASAAPSASGTLRGRIAGPAYHALAERIVEAGTSFALRAAGREWPIANAA